MQLFIKAQVPCCGGLALAADLTISVELVLLVRNLSRFLGTTQW